MMNRILILRRPGSLLLVLLCLASLVTFGYRIYKSYYVMPIDFLIFLDAGKRFEKSGELYLRAENYTEKYHPSAAIYKFPPPFQLAFVPLLELSKRMSLLELVKPTMIILYMLGLVMLVRHTSHHLKLAATETLWLSALILIIALWLMPFFESLRWLLAEIPIFFIFVLVAILPRDSKYSSTLSGLLIAYAACIKIYPVFLAGIFFYHRDKAAIAGLIIGALVISLLSIYSFGFEEHRFYISNILPVLLSEPVIDKWINLNPEKFLYNIGILDSINGTFFTVCRMVVLSIFIYVLYRRNNNNTTDNLAITSFFVSTMFFCFPNYWPQYQIFLLIPICFLIATQIQKKSIGNMIFVLLATLPLSIPDLLWSRFQGIAGNSLSLFFAILYELRAVTTVIIWLWIVRTMLDEAASPSGG